MARQLVVHESLRRPRHNLVDTLFEKMLRSAGARFAVIYAGLFVASALALAVFLWWSTAGLLTRQVEAAIRADLRGLSEQYRQGGLAALKDTIQQRIDSNVDEDAIYLLTDPTFRVVAGNLNGWPARITVDEVWAELPVVHAGIRGIAHVQLFELDGGYHLLVGRDVQSKVQMRRLLADAMLWAALIALALGMLGAWAVRRIFGLALSDISDTATAIGAGDFKRRVRKFGTGDEFDQLADTINDMLDRIGRLMDGVRQVSNAIAHDLRTPIARARARLEEAGMHAASEAELRAAIARAQTDLDDLTAIFEALLRIAEIEAGNRRSAFAELDLSPLVTDVAELYGPVADERGIALEVDAPDAARIWGDRNMLQQAIANMVDNAIKFSPPNGKVRIVVTERADAVELTVSDQGAGIPEADRKRATNRFFRGESARNTP
ncbi:MAG: HAMP domain-containing protein, partial [Acetobacteraceae bacterium]|nr:HAMP domain-containing protein [Acetobacteraceae bacterium]